MSEEKIVKALTKTMRHDILVDANWTLYKDTKAKDLEIERLNKQIEEYQKAIDETTSEKIDLENIIKEVREYLIKNIEQWENAEDFTDMIEEDEYILSLLDRENK